jgi:hypothetical protein
MRKPLVCEKLPDIGHIFCIEIANIASIPIFSMHQLMEDAIVAAKWIHKKIIDHD